MWYLLIRDAIEFAFYSFLVCPSWQKRGLVEHVVVRKGGGFVLRPKPQFSMLNSFVLENRGPRRKGERERRIPSLRNADTKDIFSKEAWETRRGVWGRCAWMGEPTEEQTASGSLNSRESPCFPSGLIFPRQVPEARGERHRNQFSKLHPPLLSLQPLHPENFN